MSDIYVGQIVLSINGEDYEIKSLEHTLKTGRTIVKTMNRKKRPLGTASGVEDYDLRVRNQSYELPIRLGCAASEQESAQTVDPSVLETSQAFAAGDDILAAARAVANGARARASHLLH